MDGLIAAFNTGMTVGLINTILTLGGIIINVNIVINN